MTEISSFFNKISLPNLRMYHAKKAIQKDGYHHVITYYLIT